MAAERLPPLVSRMFTARGKVPPVKKIPLCEIYGCSRGALVASINATQSLDIYSCYLLTSCAQLMRSLLVIAEFLVVSFVCPIN